MTEDLVIVALSVAFARRNIRKSNAPILYSDRGVLYRSQKHAYFAKSRGCELSQEHTKALILYSDNYFIE